MSNTVNTFIEKVVLFVSVTLIICLVYILFETTTSEDWERIMPDMPTTEDLIDAIESMR